MATVPSAIPYLHADPARVRAWHERLGVHDRMRIGVAWRETPKANVDTGYRDVPAAAIARLAMVPGVQLFSLPREPLPATLRGAIVELDPARDGDQVFEDTAAIMANMDLVIAPDTVYCHLAGALGKPVWTLLCAAPDWRWLRDGDTTPWYPAMQLFRQTVLGVWDDVIERMAIELSRVGAGATVG